MDFHGLGGRPFLVVRSKREEKADPAMFDSRRIFRFLNGLDGFGISPADEPALPKARVRLGNPTRGLERWCGKGVPGPVHGPIGGSPVAREYPVVRRGDP